MKNKNISSKDSETASSDSVSEKPSSLTGDKTITKVKSPVDNQPEKQSVSSDSIKRDRALYKNYSKYQESVKSQQKEDDDSRHKYLPKISLKSTTDLLPAMIKQSQMQTLL